MDLHKNLVISAFRLSYKVYNHKLNEDAEKTGYDIIARVCVYASEIIPQIFHEPNKMFDKRLLPVATLLPAAGPRYLINNRALIRRDTLASRSLDAGVLNLHLIDH
jgi:hypothetical protein